MPRSIRKVAISFGLVHVPVALYPASSESGIDFGWFDKRSMDPVGYGASTSAPARRQREHVVRSVQAASGDRCGRAGAFGRPSSANPGRARQAKRCGQCRNCTTSPAACKGADNQAIEKEARLRAARLHGCRSTGCRPAGAAGRRPSTSIARSQSRHAREGHREAVRRAKRKGQVVWHCI
jgi:hypothetical protein